MLSLTWIIDTITDVYFIVDVFLNFYTALPNEFDGTPMANRRQIAASYLKGWFFIDFVSSLPIEYIYMLIKYVAEDPAVEDATGGQIYEDVTQVREPGESSGVWYFILSYFQSDFFNRKCRICPDFH